MQAVRMRITDMRTSLSNPAAIAVKPAIAANTRAAVSLQISIMLDFLITFVYGFYLIDTIGQINLHSSSIVTACILSHNRNG